MLAVEEVLADRDAANSGSDGGAHLRDQHLHVLPWLHANGDIAEDDPEVQHQRPR
jgi:hypothetical protein